MSLLLFVAGCSAAYQRNDVTAEGVFVNESDSSDELSLTIEQPDAPLLMGSTRTVDLRFEVKIKNHLASPVTINRITLQSAGSTTIDVPVSMRKYDKVIAGKGEEKLDFWATAGVSDATLGTVRGPVVLRASVVFTVEGDQREAIFTRRVSGRVSVGVSHPASGKPR